MTINPVEWPARSEWREVLSRTWRESGDDNVGLLAAGVSFYAFLAFVPLLASVVLIYGLVAEPTTVAEHIAQLAAVLPRQVTVIIADQLQGMTETAGGEKGFGLLLAMLLALYGASRGATSTIIALNIAYEVGDSRSFLRRAGVAVLITLAAVLVLLLAALAISVLGFIESLLPSASPVASDVARILFWIGAIPAVSLGIALIYRYVPNRADAKWQWITPGSLAATLVWMAATLGFGLYVANFGRYNATYGSLGGVVVFLTWIYLTAYILIMGAELNSELERQQAEKGPEA